MTIKNKVVRTLLLLLLLVCIGCEEKPPYKIPKYPEIEQDIYFEGDYPQVVQVAYEEDGYVYHVNAVQGQVMVMFEEKVSHNEAVDIIKENHGKVVAQMPNIQYYLVEVPIGKEGEFVSSMNSIAEIDFVYPNTIEEICSVDSYVLDNFNGNHGRKVVDMMKGCFPLMDVKAYNIGTKDGRGIYSNKVEETMKWILNNIENDESVVINMSFGPKFTSLESYRKAYVDEMIKFVRIAKRFDDKDFVVVKSSGNEGVKNLEIDIKRLMNKLSPEEQDVLERHFLLVSAKDDNRQRDYPNDISSGYYNKLVTKVDISDMTSQDPHWQGTSFSSPRVAGYITSISNAHNLKATEVLQYARKATEEAPNHILTSELLEKVIEDNKNTMSEITIEGVLRMYIVNNTYDSMEGYCSYAEGGVDATKNADVFPGCYRANEYCETDGVNNYLAFVVETDQAIDVTPYLDEWDKGCLNKSSYTAFTVVPRFQYSPRDFALKYANKRVRVTGTCYFVLAGWRHATDIEMDMEKIVLCETEKATSSQGIPIGLVGTKWTASELYTTVTYYDFINNHQVKWVYSTGGCGILSGTLERILDCYYDLKKNEVVFMDNALKPYRDGQTHLKYNNGQLYTSFTYSGKEYIKTEFQRVR